MDDDVIRERLRQAFQEFVLPRAMPTPLPGLVLESLELIILDRGRGRLCSACGELIPRTAEGAVEFKYPDGRTVTFHARCEQLWQEERRRRPPR
jgi:hypothetical protein